MPRTLVIGYGNIDRADDGVAHCVVNALRGFLVQKPLSEDSSGLEELGSQTDSVFLTQLVPELMDTISGYDQVIFIDAHVYEGMEDLHCETVSSDCAFSSFTHHVTPAMLHALLKSIYHVEPTMHIVSIRGYDFDFHRGLSEKTKSQVKPAAEYILKSLIQAPKCT
jgi:hydrogenase maturation protease